MSYRTILVPVGQPDSAASAIAAAFLIARRFCGHVHGLHVLPDLTRPATHALIATRMTTEEASSDFRRFGATAEREVKRQTVEIKRLFDEAAAQVGAPTLEAASGGAVLLAWNASPQAARAVAAALPMLTQAARVVVMAVGNGPEPEPTADQLARSLAWHGVVAEPRRIEQGSGRVRDILLAEAKELRVDLLVIGAYSHSRMRQIVFGGVTEHMLDHAQLPVLMTR